MVVNSPALDLYKLRSRGLLHNNHNTYDLSLLQGASYRLCDAPSQISLYKNEVLLLNKVAVDIIIFGVCSMEDMMSCAHQSKRA